MKKMEEYDIRLDQTKKVLDTIATLIKDGGCSYRCLIYDLLGFKTDAYVPLISGLAVTNMLCDYEELKEDYRVLERDYKMLEWTLNKLVNQPYVYGIRLSSSNEEEENNG